MKGGGSVSASSTACPYPQPRAGPPSTSPSSSNLRPQFTSMSCSSSPYSYSSLECRSAGLLAIHSPLAPMSKSKSRSNFPSTTSLARSGTHILRTCASATDQALSKSTMSSATSSSSSSVREMLPKIDKSGRFCSPRAGRELALSIAYAACLEGSDPVRLLDKRINARREPGYEFDKATLLEYNHMTFGGPPVTVESLEDEQRLLQLDQKESAIEAEVLAAPPKLVYSKLILRFTRKLLVAMMDKWDDHVHVINKIAPPNWKNEPAGRILELCILHLAMAEISLLRTRHQIVINEAVDLAKRFCDGAAPRIINGCLRTFVKDVSGTSSAYALESQKLVS